MQGYVMHQKCTGVNKGAGRGCCAPCPESRRLTWPSLTRHPSPPKPLINHFISHHRLNHHHEPSCNHQAVHSGHVVHGGAGKNGVKLGFPPFQDWRQPGRGPPGTAEALEQTLHIFSNPLYLLFQASLRRTDVSQTHSGPVHGRTTDAGGQSRPV